MRFPSVPPSELCKQPLQALHAGRAGLERATEQDRCMHRVFGFEPRGFLVSKPPARNQLMPRAMAVIAAVKITLDQLLSFALESVDPILIVRPCHAEWPSLETSTSTRTHTLALESERGTERNRLLPRLQARDRHRRGRLARGSVSSKRHHRGDTLEDLPAAEARGEGGAGAAARRAQEGLAEYGDDERLTER